MAERSIWRAEEYVKHGRPNSYLASPAYHRRTCAFAPSIPLFDWTPSAATDGGRNGCETHAVSEQGNGLRCARSRIGLPCERFTRPKPDPLKAVHYPMAAWSSMPACCCRSTTRSCRPRFPPSRAVCGWCQGCAGRWRPRDRQYVDDLCSR